jgi:hypothetical protein
MIYDGAEQLFNPIGFCPQIGQPNRSQKAVLFWSSILTGDYTIV